MVSPPLTSLHGTYPLFENRFSRTPLGIVRARDNAYKSYNHFSLSRRIVMDESVVGATGQTLLRSCVVGASAFCLTHDARIRTRLLGLALHGQHINADGNAFLTWVSFTHIADMYWVIGLVKEPWKLSFLNNTSWTFDPSTSRADTGPNIQAQCDTTRIGLSATDQIRSAFNVPHGRPCHTGDFASLIH